ncbi:hypothetical protein HK096_002354 [Nowakowskiella sp. JEL0078]|nr:hypothetical protein HK096_002354 [Nowakowskiella sp. JEL0078]
MAESQIKAIASDLDGTILSHETGLPGQLSERTIAAFSTAHAAGLRIILATGRPPRLAHPIAHQIISRLNPTHLQFNPLIVICANGSITYNPLQAVVTSRISISNIALTHFVTKIRDSIPSVFSAECGTEFVRERGWPMLLADGVAPNMFVDDVLHLLEKGLFVDKLIVRSTEGVGNAFDFYDRVIALVGDSMKDSVYITVSNPHFIEITAAMISKGSVLNSYCGSIGIESKEVVAFGDMPNDIEMLKWAGYGMAVEGAHQSLKDIANAVIPRVEEDGVAQIVEKLIASNFKMDALLI